MRPYLLPLALLFIAFAHHSSAQTAPSEAEVVEVVEGAPLTVECVLGVEAALAWRVDGVAALEPDLRVAPERALPGNGKMAARLYAAAARQRHAGLYTCTSTPASSRPVRVRVVPAALASIASAKDAVTTEGAPTEEPAAADDDVATKLDYELKKELLINCTGTPALPLNDLVWSVNKTRLDKLEESVRKRLDVSEAGLLRVRISREDDWGRYECRVGSTDELVNSWDVRAHPLARMAANAVVVEGQVLTLTCRQLGKPPRPVTWMYRPPGGNNDTALVVLDLSPVAGRFKTRDSPTKIPNAVLEVTGVQSEDAGDYFCLPTGEDMLHGAHTTVFVKDVYAALWPFLGICLEVVVLCAVILVYEKRRTKPELDDSDADTHDQ